MAYYSGAANRLEQVGQLHWVGGQPPRDSPICGYDKSKCPKVSQMETTVGFTVTITFTVTSTLYL